MAISSYPSVLVILQTPKLPMSLKDSIRGSYASVMRAVSTEAATTANANDACFKDFQPVEIPEVMARINATVPR